MKGARTTDSGGHRVETHGIVYDRTGSASSPGVSIGPVAELARESVSASFDESAFLAEVIARSPDVYLLVDRAGIIEWVSSQVTALLGFDASELVGQRVEQLVPDELRDVHVGHREILEPGVDYERQHLRILRAVNSDGSLVPVDVRLKYFSGDRALAVMRDARELARVEDQLQVLAGTDPLTGIPNRRMTVEHLDSALGRAKRRGSILAVAFVDLDGFKEINDTFGHGAGDEVLRAVASRLQAALRAGDLVGRFGGDEFVVTIEGLGTDSEQARTEVQQALERLLEQVAQPIDYGSQRLKVSVSAGMALAVGASIERAELLDLADKALYSAKRDVGNRVVIASS